ncbi:glycosyltransferase family 2 protein [bacterium 1XD21-13]|nr:glycosyltransferase family 2 protein [bacterium 1XD21-13]
MSMNSTIVIPALNPPEHLITYVDDLIRSGASKFLIVDDGSSVEKQYIFQKLSLRPECQILIHENNQGKGRALKDAFSYILSKEEYKGQNVITADSNGQHLAADILRLDFHMQNTSHSSPCLFLGCRNFEKENIPWRSRFGNRLTSLLFRLLYQETIMDTQTGLRGIPYEFLEPLSKLKGGNDLNTK